MIVTWHKDHSFINLVSAKGPLLLCKLPLRSIHSYGFPCELIHFFHNNSKPLSSCHSLCKPNLTIGKRCLDSSSRSGQHAYLCQDLVPCHPVCRKWDSVIIISSFIEEPSMFLMMLDPAFHHIPLRVIHLDVAIILYAECMPVIIYAECTQRCQSPNNDVLVGYARQSQTFSRLHMDIQFSGLCAFTQYLKKCDQTLGGTQATVMAGGIFLKLSSIRS